MLTRRAFLNTTVAAGAATLTGVSSLAAAKYDLVIIGGRVIDPARHIDGMRDMAIGGKPVRSRS
jgi:hypothetical protein